MSVPLSTDGRETIERRLLLENIQEHDIYNFYEIDRCVSWIKRNNFTRVALQFPDELLQDSSSVYSELLIKTAVELVILADTTYGSCCVDEIAAQHAMVDAIIHYGHTCLSPSARLPVLYVLGSTDIQPRKCDEAFQNFLSSTSSRVLIFYDVVYHNSFVANLADKWVKCDRVTVANLCLPDGDGKEQCISENESAKMCLGRSVELPTGVSVDQCVVFYIGHEGAALSNLMMVYNKCAFHTYDPRTGINRRETLSVNRRLMQRYYMVEKVRSASVVGILVGTLGVSQYVDLVDRVKQLLIAAGKQYYTIAVGKPNPAKLANFIEIEVYVLIACPENTLLDSVDYYQSIVTPFELEVALNEAQEWTGEYVTDFRELLHRTVATKSEPQYDVSLISGSVHQIGISQADDDALVGSGDLTLSTRDPLQVTLASNIGVNTSQRTWQGLDPQLGATPVTKAVEGARGTSLKYDYENNER